MNNKRYLLFITCLLPFTAFAQVERSDQLPILPKPGVQIVSAQQTGMSIKEQKEQFRLKQEFKLKGYIEKSIPYAHYLLNIKNDARKEIEAYKNTDASDTHLKGSAKDIKLAFAYHDISFLKPEDVIGYAAVGRWDDGWYGIRTFFNDQAIGVCQFTFEYIPPGKGGVILNKENIRYDVNKKPTSVSVVGSQASGFLYKVYWYEDLYLKNLICANKHYQKTLMNHLIMLANKIDAVGHPEGSDRSA